MSNSHRNTILLLKINLWMETIKRVSDMLMELGKSDLSYIGPMMWIDDLVALFIYLSCLFHYYGLVPNS